MASIGRVLGARTGRGAKSVLSHLPAAAALLGILFYTGLLTSHIVSQATAHLAPATQSEAQASGEHCHDSPDASGGSKQEPASPKKSCPFCVGYASLQLALAAAGSTGTAPAENAAPRLVSGGEAHHHTLTRSPQSRGPPIALA